MVLGAEPNHILYCNKEYIEVEMIMNHFILLIRVNSILEFLSKPNTMFFYQIKKNGPSLVLPSNLFRDS